MAPSQYSGSARQTRTTRVHDRWETSIAFKSGQVREEHAGRGNALGGGMFAPHAQRPSCPPPGPYRGRAGEAGRAGGCARVDTDLGPGGLLWTLQRADGPAPATLAFCWAHVRRKFFEAKPFAPACEQALALIGELYAIEAGLPGWYALTGQVRQAALAHRLAVRQQHFVPVVERIRQWALTQRAAPGSAMLKLWGGLTVFLRTPEVPLDTGHGEQLRDAHQRVRRPADAHGIHDTCRRATCRSAAAPRTRRSNLHRRRRGSAASARGPRPSSRP